MNIANNTNTKTAEPTAATPRHSVTTVESLVREARRRGFHLCGGFHPPEIIPMVQAQIAEHNTRERGFTELSGDYHEWKQTMDNLTEFLVLLKSLPERLPYEAQIAETNSGTREKIQHLQKQIENHIADLPPSIQQQLTGVPHPSIQASDTRRTPVPHPSKDASDASANASPKPEAPFNESITERIERERAEYLAQILRESSPSKSPIDDFPPERQQSLYQLIQDVPLTAAVKILAAPEPQGWNFKTTDTSLRRFRERYEKKLRAAELAAAHSEAQQTIQQTGADEQTYMTAARRLLKIRLYKNAADPEGSDEELELLMRLLDRQRRTDLAERRVKVAEQKAAQ